MRCPDLPSHAAAAARSASGFGMWKTVSLPGQVELIWRKHENRSSLTQQICGLCRLCSPRRPAALF